MREPTGRGDYRGEGQKGANAGGSCTGREGEA